MNGAIWGTGMGKGLTIAAIAIAGLMLVLSIMDLAVGIPFGKQYVGFDVVFLICSALMLLLGITTWREVE
jgi:hypothetical protein